MGLMTFKLCDFLLSNFDEEDLYYIQKCLCLLFPNTEMCDLMDKNLNPFISYKQMLSDVVQHSIDEEGLGCLKRRFNILFWERSWMREMYWVDHAAAAHTAISSSDQENLPALQSGCARSEGYFKIDKPVSSKKRSVNKQPVNLTVTDTPYAKIYKSNKESTSRDARNYQRRLCTLYQGITQSDLLKLNELKFRKKKLVLGRSEIHGMGVFAAELIGPKEIIIEYTGQLIRPIVADLREKVYRKSGIGSYCFRVDNDTIIDATKVGSLNRFINHSCSPNSYARVLIIDNKKKIVIYSRKTINIGVEITYNYKMPYEDEKIPCLCNARGCRKFLN